MKSCITALLICYVIVAICSCSYLPNTVTTSLARAEELMATHPDSALRLLENLSYSEKLTGEHQADFILLTAQGRDKNYKDMSADSSIAFSVSYFKNSGDTRKYAKSLYYYGRVFQTNGNAARAMKLYLEVCRLLEGTDEYKILGLAYENASILYREQSLYNEAISCCRKAIKCYDQINDTVNISYAYQTMGSLYFYQKEMDSVYSCASKSLQFLKNPPLRLEIGASKLLGMMYSYEKEYEQAEKLLLKVLHVETDLNKMTFHYISIGRLYQLMGKRDKAEKYLLLSMSSPSYFTRSAAYRYLSEIYIKDGDYRKAVLFMEKGDSLYNIAENVGIRETLLQLQTKYKNEKREMDYLKAETKKWTLILNFSIALFIFGVLFCGLYQRYGNTKLKLRRINKERARIEQRIKLYLNEMEICHKEKLDDNEKADLKIQELKRKIGILIDRNQKLLGKMDVVSIITRLKQGDFTLEDLTTEDMDKIYNLVNSLHSNILQRLYKENNSLTKHDKNLLSFLLLNFSTNELISVFQSKDSHSIFKAKSRLKERLKMKKEDSWDDFLESCHK